MKLVRFLYKDKVCKGVLEGGKVSCEGVTLSIEDIRILPPVIPTKIASVGLNYVDHAKELGMVAPEEPIIFLKPSTSVIGHKDTIICPSASERVDYEAELGVVIKKTARYVNAEDAAEYIEGYTCFNDVTARDLQEKDGQWTRAKSFDTFAPIGPYIETELDPSDLGIRSFLNGTLKQDSRTSKFIFDVPHLVEFISGVMTLLPGDIIATGTPPGIGPMEPGDEIVVEIDGIGRLVNKVGKGSAE